ncbi:MAG: hypothetical protein FRX49_06104 [Trebouxia sp. A1-2]|nr:MAG: hypothetical protein FRX49_06104 [Trebouxia sp. A1-2]
MRQQEGYLHVLVRVPVTVIDNDGVSRGEVDAQATSPGGQQEDEDVGVGIEGADGFLTILPAHAAINAAGLVALALQALQHALQQLHLATLGTDLLGGWVGDAAVKGPFDEFLRICMSTLFSLDTLTWAPPWDLAMAAMVTPCGMCLVRSFWRSSLLPWYRMTFMEGSHRLNSSTQLDRVDRGPTTMKGP